MKIIITFVCVLISIILWKKYINYEDYKNEPYITVYAKHGLNNKLQVILSYLYKANQEGKKLRIIWIKNKDCPENFDNLFKPINNIEFVYTDENKDYDYNTWSKENNEYIKKGYYKLLQPIDSIQDEVDKIISLLNNNYISCHIRRTDSGKVSRRSDKEYMEFIDQYSKELKIYIAIDCRKTQELYIDKYGDRLIYKKIEDNNNLRQTSIQDAVKDMYVCAGATYFLGCPGSHSSFTNGIIELRKINNK
jgi:hypothetical protein